MLSQVQKKDGRHIAYYVVAFIDILGQRDTLRKLKTLPDENNPEDKEIIKSTFGLVDMFRKCFQGFFNGYITKLNEIASLTETQKNIMVKLDSHPIKMQSFSDCVVIYLCLETGESKIPEKGIFGILAAACSIFLNFLADGHAIRGGIDLGVAMEISDNNIYGSALVKAYDLESKIAQYPRIVIGEELESYLKSVVDEEETDEYSRIRKKAAGLCQELLKYDDDGYPIIDYLGDGFKRHVSSSVFSQTKKAIESSHKNLINQYEKHRKNKDSKLALRYSLLRNYFNDRLQLW